jgi:hypothetical protein
MAPIPLRDNIRGDDKRVARARLASGGVSWAGVRGIAFSFFLRGHVCRRPLVRGKHRLTQGRVRWVIENKDLGRNHDVRTLPCQRNHQDRDLRMQH